MSKEKKNNRKVIVKTRKGRNGGTLLSGGTGRPKGSRNFKTRMDKIFNLVASDNLKMDFLDIDPKIKDNFDLFTAATFAHAVKGDSASKNIILDRYFGKVTDKTELTGDVNVNIDPEILAVAKILNERKRNKE